MAINMDSLIEELEAAASETNKAELRLVEAIMAELNAEAVVKNFEALLQIEVADKEKHPELTNDKTRNAWVQIELGREKSVAVWLIAKRKKLEAQARYNYCRRREADLRAIVGGRNAT